VNEKQEIGKKGEEHATKYLIEKNYKIIQRNFECKQGEIDIIAKDKNEYVFIEVKTRQNLNYGMPSESVTIQKQKHIKNATKYYIYLNKLENQYIRFDVIEIFIKNNKYYLNHLKNVM